MLCVLGNLAIVEVLEQRVLMSATASPSVGAGPLGFNDGDGTYYVSPNGSPTNDGTVNSPWNTVEYALGRVGGGHTIILEPGTYAPIHIDMAYQGTADHPTVIRSQYKWQAIIAGNGQQVHDVDFTYGSSWITFDGLQVTNSQIDGIKANGNNITIENCWIHNNNENGILIVGYNNDTITNNLVEHNGSSTTYDHGMYIYGTGMVITGNIVRHNSGCGLNLSPSSDGFTVDDNLVYGQDNLPSVYFSHADGKPLNTFTNNIVICNYAEKIRDYGQPFGVDSGNVLTSLASTSELDAITSNNISDYLNTATLRALQNQSVLSAPASPTTSYDGCADMGDGERYIAIRINSSVPINLSSIVANGITVTGPNGYSQNSASIYAMCVYSATSIEVYYKIPRPGATWDATDDGNYSVSIANGAFHDTANNSVVAAYAGKFTINIPASDTVPPTVRLSDTDGVTAGRPITNARIIFDDDVAVSAADVQNIQIRVTNSSGYSVLVTPSWVSHATDSSEIEVHYAVPAPGGSWTYADNGRYTLTLVSNVHDASGNVLTAGTVIGYFDISLPAPDLVPPTLTLANAGTSTFGVATRDFTVTYHDASGVNASTVDGNDLTITGPNGFSQTAQLVGDSSSTDGTTVTATYRMAAPGGMWDSSDNGLYTVSLAAGAVTDVYGNGVATQQVTQFTAAVQDPLPVLQSYSAAQTGQTYVSLTIKSTLAPVPMVVNGPNGLSEAVEIINTVAGANGGYVSTCRVLAPGGTWDYTDNGAYTIVPKSTVGLAAGSVGMFTVDLAKIAPAPTGTLSRIGSVSASQPYVEVTLSYSNGLALKPGAFTPDLLQLQGPKGYVQNGQIVSQGNTDSTHVAVTYRFAAPGGTWDYTDNGTYTIYKMTTKKTIAGTLGKFSVALAAPKTPVKTVRSSLPAVASASTTGIFAAGPITIGSANILAEATPLRFIAA